MTGAPLLLVRWSVLVAWGVIGVLARLTVVVVEFRRALAARRGRELPGRPAPERGTAGPVVPAVRPPAPATRTSGPADVRLPV